MCRALLLRSTLCLIACFPFASAAQAVESFKVIVSNNLSEGPAPVCVLDVEQIIGSPGSAQVYVLTSGCADRGILKSKAFVATLSCTGGCPGGVNNSAGALSLFTVDDVSISCPSGPTSVHAILHMVLEGNISASPPPNWTAQVLVTINFPGVVGTGAMTLDLGGNWSSTGILAGQLGPGPVSLPIDLDLGMVDVDTPRGLTVVLEARAGDNPPPGGSTANSNFFEGGLHFPTSGPVFTLPPGCTASIPSLSVVNNEWHGNPTRARKSTWGMLKQLYR